MKKIIYFLILVKLTSCSCEKPDIAAELTPPKPQQDTVVTYIIKKGNHYADQSSLQLLNKPAIVARITFDSSAIYTSVDPVNQADVNKLIGFSDCGTDHQQNSARLGWSWNGNELILYAYAYVNSQRIIKTLGAVPLKQTINCSVNAASNYYYFKAFNYTDSIPRHCLGYTGVSYKLYPYFGGDEVAPHEVHIAILEQSAMP